jgi:hypothetical protein
MEEAQAILGVLLISAVAATGYFVINAGATGAQTSQSYIACCCNILTTSGPQVIVRSQIQTFAGNCQTACQRYELEAGRGMVFPQQGLCAANP